MPDEGLSSTLNGRAGAMPARPTVLSARDSQMTVAKLLCCTGADGTAPFRHRQLLRLIGAIRDAREKYCDAHRLPAGKTAAEKRERGPRYLADKAQELCGRHVMFAVCYCG